MYIIKDNTGRVAMPAMPKDKADKMLVRLTMQAPKGVSYVVEEVK